MFFPAPHSAKRQMQHWVLLARKPWRPRRTCWQPEQRLPRSSGPLLQQPCRCRPLIMTPLAGRRLSAWPWMPHVRKWLSSICRYFFCGFVFVPVWPACLPLSFSLSLSFGCIACQTLQLDESKVAAEATRAEYQRQLLSALGGWILSPPFLTNRPLRPLVISPHSFHRFRSEAYPALTPLFSLSTCLCVPSVREGCSEGV